MCDRNLGRQAACFVAASLALASCHVVSRVDETTTGGTSIVPANPRKPRALAMELSVTEGGMFRFREPLVCRDDVMLEQYTWSIASKEPNVATAIIGIIVAAAGAIAAVSGLSNDSNALTYRGAAGVVVGLPFVVGPFIGNSSERTLVSETSIKQNSEVVACGDRPVRAWSATLSHAKLEIAGTVDDNGVFSVSPFTFVDAFAVHDIPGVDLTAVLIGDDGVESRIETVMSADTLARGRDGFLAAANIDGRVERLLNVPSLSARELTVTRTAIENKLPAVKISVTVDNAGPGEAWGVRGRLSSRHPGIDGRFLYIGHLDAKDSATATLELQLRPHGAELSDAHISVILFDAHDTTPNQPLDFTGPILNDAY